MVHLLATAAGLVAVFTTVPLLYTALKVAGAPYLLYLAYQALRGRKGSPFESRELPKDPNWRLFTMGLLTNLLNPKIAMLYVALLPQFIEPARGHIAAQALQLGLVQITVALIGNTLIILAAGKLATFLVTRPRWLRLQRYLMASVLGVLALRMLTDHARPAAVLGLFAAFAVYRVAVTETMSPELQEWRLQLDPMLAGLQDFALASEDSLDGSGESLLEVEEFLLAEVPPGEVPPEGLAYTVGGYLGEALLDAGGGAWVWDEESDLPIIQLDPLLGLTIEPLV